LRLEFFEDRADAKRFAFARHQCFGRSGELRSRTSWSNKKGARGWLSPTWRAITSSVWLRPVWRFSSWRRPSESACVNNPPDRSSSPPIRVILGRRELPGAFRPCRPPHPPSESLKRPPTESMARNARPFFESGRGGDQGFVSLVQGGALKASLTNESSAMWFHHVKGESRRIRGPGSTVASRWRISSSAPPPTAVSRPACRRPTW